MAETKFTPGPWDIKENLGTDEAYCDWHKVGPVDLMGGKANGNSHLIAAAPELYEAANVALSRLQLTGGKDGEYLGNHEKKMIEVLSKALAKARGEAV